MTEPGYVAPASPGWWVRTQRIGVADTGYEWQTSVAGETPVLKQFRTLMIANPRTGPQALRNRFRQKPRSRTKSSPTVSFTAVGSGTKNGSSSNIYSGASVTHTGNAGDTPILFVSVMNTAAQTFTMTATYNGVAMTQINTPVLSYFSSGRAGLVAFGLIGGCTGSSATVSFTVSPNVGSLICNCVSYTLSSWGTPVTATATSGTPSVTASSNYIVAGAIDIVSASSVANFSQTSRYSENVSVNNAHALNMGDGTGGSVSFTSTTSGNWGALAIPLNA